MTKLIVNFFGGPSAGKTTAAAELFSVLKKQHIDCELVAEFPKDLVLENNTIALSNQIYVFANQLYRIQCAHNSTSVAIVDSPLLLSCIYNKDKSSEAFKNLVLEEHHKFNNLNIVMERDKTFPYSMSGRIHGEIESDKIHDEIIQLMEKNDINYLRHDEFNESEDLVSIITAFLLEDTDV